ncbi:hypothetical protein VTK56DRAFT_7616 [Thermocarpiscus australiensis]
MISLMALLFAGEKPSHSWRVIDFDLQMDSRVSLMERRRGPSDDFLSPPSQHVPVSPENFDNFMRDVSNRLIMQLAWAHAHMFNIAFIKAKEQEQESDWSDKVLQGWDFCLNRVLTQSRCLTSVPYTKKSKTGCRQGCTSPTQRYAGSVWATPTGTRFRDWPRSLGPLLQASWSRSAQSSPVTRELRPTRGLDRHASCGTPLMGCHTILDGLTTSS